MQLPENFKETIGQFFDGKAARKFCRLLWHLEHLKHCSMVQRKESWPWQKIVEAINLLY